MFKALKIWWLQHLKDVEEYKKQDIARMKLEIRSYVMRFYEEKYKLENNPIPYWLEAEKEISNNIKSDADVLYYYNKIKRYIKSK